MGTRFVAVGAAILVIGSCLLVLFGGEQEETQSSAKNAQGAADHGRRSSSLGGGETAERPIPTSAFAEAQRRTRMVQDGNLKQRDPKDIIPISFDAAKFDTWLSWAKEDEALVGQRNLDPRLETAPPDISLYEVDPSCHDAAMDMFVRNYLTRCGRKPEAALSLPGVRASAIHLKEAWEATIILAQKLEFVERERRILGGDGAPRGALAYKDVLARRRRILSALNLARDESNRLLSQFGKRVSGETAR